MPLPPTVSYQTNLSRTPVRLCGQSNYACATAKLDRCIASECTICTAIQPHREPEVIADRSWTEKNVTPPRPDRLLAPDVPHIEPDAIFLQGLDIESLGRHYSLNVFIRKFFDDCCFATIVQTKNQKPCLRM